MKSFYDILGVSESASDDDIKSAFRKLARLYHPDVNSSKEAEDKMKLINQAYETLSDASKRAKYDRDRKDNTARTSHTSTDATDVYTATDFGEFTISVNGESWDSWLVPFVINLNGNYQYTIEITTHQDNQYDLAWVDYNPQGELEACEMPNWMFGEVEATSNGTKLTIQIITQDEGFKKATNYSASLAIVQTSDEYHLLYFEVIGDLVGKPISEDKGFTGTWDFEKKETQADTKRQKEKSRQRPSSPKSKPRKRPASVVNLERETIHLYRWGTHHISFPIDGLDTQPQEVWFHEPHPWLSSITYSRLAGGRYQFRYSISALDRKYFPPTKKQFPLTIFLKHQTTTYRIPINIDWHPGKKIDVSKRTTRTKPSTPALELTTQRVVAQVLKPQTSLYEVIANQKPRDLTVTWTDKQPWAGEIKLLKLGQDQTRILIEVDTSELLSSVNTTTRISVNNRKTSQDIDVTLRYEAPHFTPPRTTTADPSSKSAHPLRTSAPTTITKSSSKSWLSKRGRRDVLISIAMLLSCFICWQYELLVHGPNFLGNSQEKSETAPTTVVTADNTRPTTLAVFTPPTSTPPPISNVNHPIVDSYDLWNEPTRLRLREDPIHRLDTGFELPPLQIEYYEYQNQDTYLIHLDESGHAILVPQWIIDNGRFYNSNWSIEIIAGQMVGSNFVEDSAVSTTIIISDPEGVRWCYGERFACGNDQSSPLGNNGALPEGLLRLDTVVSYHDGTVNYTSLPIAYQWLYPRSNSQCQFEISPETNHLNIEAPINKLINQVTVMTFDNHGSRTTFTDIVDIQGNQTSYELQEDYQTAVVLVYINNGAVCIQRYDDQ